jgi:murein DD-endopeptidase MepM/ murein hydrolase activator NlpD
MSIEGAEMNRILQKIGCLVLCALTLCLLFFSGATRCAEAITPLLLAVQEAPVPFLGSDDQTHLVYELQITNFSNGEVLVQNVDVIGDGKMLAHLDNEAIASRLQPIGRREPRGTLAPSEQALLFVHVVLAADASIPRQIVHQVSARTASARPSLQELRESGGETPIDRRQVVVIGAPLRGARFISADSCCDASRHTRAVLPVNGRVFLAQRFAVDWEQLDGAGRIYAGAQSDPSSYAVYGREVLAVADAAVVTVQDGLPDQQPGKMPAEIALEQADGNSIVLDLGTGHYALYAHLRAGSITVKPGDRVKRGQSIARVGNSGNTLAPHLHFHIMDTPSPLASNGLPYAIDGFQVTGSTKGTPAFDKAEADGTPLAIAQVIPARAVRNALPLDQLEISFASSAE